MSWTGWLVVLLAGVCGAWMAFDGTRALVIGDFVTPTSGPYAGQLGPWARVLEAVGIPPRAMAIKLAFVVYGATQLASVAAFAAGAAWAPRLLLATAALGLWYVPFGTLLNGAAIVLLLGYLRNPGG